MKKIRRVGYEARILEIRYAHKILIGSLGKWVGYGVDCAFLCDLYDWELSKRRFDPGHTSSSQNY
jgi:hypothetical protein